MGAISSCLARSSAVQGEKRRPWENWRMIFVRLREILSLLTGIFLGPLLLLGFIALMIEKLGHSHKSYQGGWEINILQRGRGGERRGERGGEKYGLRPVG